MRIIRFTDANFEVRLAEVTAASPLFDKAVEDKARLIVEGIATRGDDALLKFVAQFDGVTLSKEQLRVAPHEIKSARRRVPLRVRRATAIAARNIHRFSRHSLRKDWKARNEQGALVGERFIPFERVGIYIPGGSAPLVSTVLMTVTLAKAAGCREIVVCTPCKETPALNPVLLATAAQAGATEIYRIGGAQAIAAMALGTPSIRPVQKVFGPGNAFVVAAKRLLFGKVAIDLLPGPSEVLVLADGSAEPRFVAADLLAQAEQGSTRERVWLVTDSAPLLTAVHHEMERQLARLSRRNVIEAALKQNACLIQVKTIADGITLANRIAPEHCQIMTRNGTSVSKRITSAGAVFIGQYSPTVAGDYVAGPSHVLPTGGSAKSFSGLTADQFQRRMSLIEYSKRTLKASVPTIVELAGVESLTAHARSALERFRG
jgi:histidinol dehydrogenase